MKNIDNFYIHDKTLYLYCPETDRFELGYLQEPTKIWSDSFNYILQFGDIGIHVKSVLGIVVR